MSEHKPEGQDQVIHEVDGIQEYDNHLPNWWLYTLYGAVVFAIFYWFHYHVLETGDVPPRAFRKEMAEIAEKQGKALPVTAESLMDLVKDGKSAAEGSTVYATTCAPCHAPTGGGNIGPNLTDEYWMHGGGPEQIYKSVKEGFPTKGMPAWGPQLGDKRVLAVTAYVLSIRNSNVPGGKPPQGEKHAAK
jgi:cytochrome c oxidase cbb3-type subunit 3